MLLTISTAYLIELTTNASKTGYLFAAKITICQVGLIKYAFLRLIWLKVFSLCLAGAAQRFSFKIRYLYLGAFTKLKKATLIFKTKLQLLTLISLRMIQANLEKYSI